jgi:hypothetical protein
LRWQPVLLRPEPVSTITSTPPPLLLISTIRRIEPIYLRKHLPKVLLDVPERGRLKRNTEQLPSQQESSAKDGDGKYYEKLLDEFDGILVDKVPNELPPLREINHWIPFKPSKPWVAHKFRLSEVHKAALDDERTSSPVSL